MKALFERQILHLLLLALLAAGALLATRYEGVLAGSLGGLSTASWFWLSLLCPLLHQGFVWLCWRVELHGQRLSGRFGAHGFRLYAAGFAILSIARIFTIVALALANRGTLVGADPVLLALLALAVALPAAYGMYSVARYFGFRRALGIDHFDPAYRTKPFVREGIYRWTSNGMYGFVIPILWLPGLLAQSKAALVSALFTNLYIWVHYFCTEVPDMRRIYGAVPGDAPRR
ncbi:MAG: methyltransferase [Planctomycetota bacterium]|jgi:hypothetical protein